MKKSNSLTNRSGLLGVALVAMATAFGVSSCKTDFDLDKKTPEWLGTSIFETLDEGFKNDSTGKFYHFENFVRLIQDLDQEKILAKTGSKTLFVADDEAFERFFGPNCPFKKADGTPVTCYDELSVAQKTMILKGSMLNNVYQVAMLSSSQGPTIGDCMRRLSSSSVYDTIPVLTQDKMPDTKLWSYYKNDPARKEGIALMQDGTIRPMIFFVNKFLTMKKITDDDYDFLFNQGAYDPTGVKPARKPADASVNGVKIEFQNKKCFNGFLHVMSDVIYLLPNMAEYLESDNGKSIIYSRIVDRFSAPFYIVDERTSRNQTDDINRLIADGKAYLPESTRDSVFTKMYFAKRSQGDKMTLNLPVNISTGTKPFGEQQTLLKFDPGWNTFFSQTSASTETNIALQRDMAVMLVPTDTTMAKWWLEGGGAPLRERYGLYKDTYTVDQIKAMPVPERYQIVAEDMDGVPEKVISKLLNNNMLNSLVASVPSKFPNVLNDANDPMYLQTNDIEEVVMCCNGAIYFTTKVYSPTAYCSVSYPALVNEKLQIIDWAIEDETLSFSAYLNSMVSTYSFFIPTTVSSSNPDFDDKLIWIDPVSFALNRYGSTVAEDEDYIHALVFRYDEKNSTVKADLCRYDYKSDTVMAIVSTFDGYDAKIRESLRDLLDYHIIIGDVENPSNTDANGYAYFQTKGRGTIRFKTAADFHDMEVAGGWQLETGQKINITERYDLTLEGNGRTYLIDKPLMTSRRSVYDVLSDSVNYPEFKEFFNLASSVEGIFKENVSDYELGSRMGVSTFNTYHYTVYVPTNQSIKDLMATGVLYSPAKLAAFETYWNGVRDDLKAEYEDDMDKVDSILTDSMVNFSKRLRGAVPTDPSIAEDSLYRLPADFIAARSKELANFVKYHIQDNSVYVGAEFNAGREENGELATSTKYETAYMNSRQKFEKLSVKGGKDITLTDAVGNVRQVKTNDEKYYNIMCREYQYTNKNTDPMLSTLDVIENQIETSSYAVIHLIDGPLCNGELHF